MMVNMPNEIIAILAATTSAVLGNISAFILTHKIKNKIQFHRLNVLENCEIIAPPKLSSQNFSLVDYPESLGEYRQEVMHFVETLQKNLTEDQLTRTYNNIKNLRIDENALLHLYRICGLYRASNNTITMSTQKVNLPFGIKLYFFSDIDKSLMSYHELFHMASTTYKGDEYFMGFSQRNIGDGINEGYTDLLVARYFSNYSKNIGYKLEANFASLTEQIIGQEKMTDAYFKSDLLTLITELENYTDREKARQYLSDLDIVTAFRRKQFLLTDSDKSKLLESYNKIKVILYEAYSKKLDKELSNNNLTAAEYSKCMNSFIESLSKYDYLIVKDMKKLNTSQNSVAVTQNSQKHR